MSAGVSWSTHPRRWGTADAEVNMNTPSVQCPVSSVSHPRRWGTADAEINMAKHRQFNVSTPPMGYRGCRSKHGNAVSSVSHPLSMGYRGCRSKHGQTPSVQCPVSSVSHPHRWGTADAEVNMNTPSAVVSILLPRGTAGRL